MRLTIALVYAFLVSICSSLALAQTPKPGSVFKDCDKCPPMVVVPAGTFSMGSTELLENPQHPVTLARHFAVGKFALTFDEWDACVAEGSCTDHNPPSDHSWGRGRLPVIHVSWDDAKAYVGWLAKLSGQAYRLMTEAEYEYTTRAGTTTEFPWGDAVGTNNASCDGCGSQWDGKQTAPVGSFAPNRFGLYDMVGNVWEWTEDCYHYSYKGAPADGSAWTSGDWTGGNCSRRVVRGGSWINQPRYLRSARRDGFDTDVQSNFLGFRVARTLLTP